MNRLRLVFGLSLTATVFAALAFVNNVVALVRWWRAFLAAGGDTARIASKAAGLFPWLDWSAVDYSSVTTLIPLIGFACMTLGAGRLLRGRSVKGESFPFFEGSDQLHIALGLFGTLWGIIVIGYFKLDTVTMADLMQCLHTALFSTLMAVVWVFLVDRPLVRPLFRRLLDSSGCAASEDGDLAAAVDRLVERLDAASDAFDRRQREFEAAFAKREAEQYAAFEKRSAGYAAAFEKRLADYQSEFEARQREYTEFFTRRIAELEKEAEAADRRAAEAESKIDAIATIARSRSN